MDRTHSHRFIERVFNLGCRYETAQSSAGPRGFSADRYPESALVGTGILLFACTLLYLTRRTSVVGTVLLTGYLGGAVAINVRAEQPAFNVVFPVIFGGILWVGLYLRESRLAHLALLHRKS
ncbi:MAG: DoxX family protein [Acidobacteriaceae bacterium]|nr:DoxX family protein [Acidobacteriaceae bacterium]